MPPSRADVHDLVSVLKDLFWWVLYFAFSKFGGEWIKLSPRPSHCLYAPLGSFS